MNSKVSICYFLLAGVRIFLLYHNFFFFFSFYYIPFIKSSLFRAQINAQSLGRRCAAKEQKMKKQRLVLELMEYLSHSIPSCVID